MTKPIQVITATKLATSFSLRPELHAWLLGAGASAASGIPTGYAMIRDFKATLYCQETRLPRRDIDPSDPLWTQRIDDHFSHSTTLPPPNDPTEYAAAFEAVYPLEIHRRQYIDDAVKLGSPCFGHRALAALMADGKVDCVFTTNFDPLIEDSSTLVSATLPSRQAKKPTVAALDSAQRATRCLDEADWPLIAKLHGDYQSASLKNTDAELRSQDHDMRRTLVEACKRFGLIVVGYSGRDASIIATLESVLDYDNPFPSGLYWCTSSRSSLLPAVEKLLERAAHSGVNVFVVETATFDELAGDLIDQIKLPDSLLQYVLSFRPSKLLEAVPLPERQARRFPVLRLSALLVETMPTSARRLSIRQAATTVEVRKLLKAAKCQAVAAVMGRDVAVFGRDADVMNALHQLDPTLAGVWSLNPERDSWAMGLIYDALLKALARHRPLVPRMQRAGHSLFVASGRDGEPAEYRQRRDVQLSELRKAYSTPLTGVIYGRRFQEAISVRLERIEDRWWCGFDPFTLVDAPPEERSSISDQPEDDGTGAIWAAGRRPVDPTADWRREQWARRYNNSWAALIDAWAKLLIPSEGNALHAFGLGDSEGVDAAFTLSPVTGWSRPAHQHAYFNRRQ